MADTLYFPPENFPYMQVELLMQILSYQKTFAIVISSPAGSFTREMIDTLASTQRDEILRSMHAQYGKPPDLQ